MNKILNINLGGYAITIDDDAFEHISAYLESIRRRFSESDGRDEIMRDIESRLGEIITNGLGNRSIVMLPDVEAAIEVMGKPEDFGGEPMEKLGADKSAKRIITPAKKLFRDEQDAVIGGVCSGLVAYFGFQETVWMRIGFVALALFSFGFWVPAYILLWILVPPARTAAERLAMRGETPNVENIAREIEKGAERFSKKVNEFGSTMGSSAGRNSAAVASGCLTVVGKLFLGLVIFIAIAMIFGLGTTWVAGIWAFITAQPYIDYFSPLSTTATYLGFFNGFFLLGIPIVALVLWLGRTIFRFKSPAWLGSGMSILWVLNFVSLVLLVGLAFVGFRQSGSVSKTMDLSGIGSDTLQVKWAGRNVSEEHDDWFVDGEDIRIGNKRLDVDEMVRVRVRSSESGRFEYAQVIRARGATGEEATEHAANTNFEAKIEGNTLLLPSGYFIKQGKKWRVQEVRITIGVPEGKHIVFGEVINRRVREVDYSDYDNDENTIRRNPGKVFRMTPQGLQCNDCPRFGDRRYRSGRSFENFILEGKFDTEIIKDDNFSIEFEGGKNDKDAIETIRSGDNLTLTSRGKTLSGNVRCVIRTPVFTKLVADNTGNVTIRGFKEGRSAITTKGPVRVRGFFDSSDLDLNLMGKCFVEITGNSDELTATLSEGAELEASGWRTHRAELSASDASRARLNVEEHAVVKSDASSSVKITGPATVEQQ